MTTEKTFRLVLEDRIQEIIDDFGQIRQLDDGERAGTTQIIGDLEDILGEAERETKNLDAGRRTLFRSMDALFGGGEINSMRMNCHLRWGLAELPEEHTN